MSITMSFAGNNCNNFFQYALMRIICMKNGYEFYIPEEVVLRLLKFFPGLNVCDANSFEQKHEWYEPLEQPFDPEIFNVKDGTYIHGFFQTHKYFDGFTDYIKDWFVVRGVEIVNWADTCYIHFRGRDYTGGWNQLPPSYYEKARNVIRTHNPNVVFRILTDDPENAKEYFPYDIVLSGDDVEDFKTLCSARYLILSNSSYSWWSAWLNQRCELSVAPNRWFNYNKNFDRAGLGKSVENCMDWYPADIQNNRFTFID